MSKLEGKITNLTGVRGVAALWVVIFHAQSIGKSSFTLGPILDHGFLGVDVFFILSGFVLSLVYSPKVPANFQVPWFKSYLLRRLAKIYPLHLLTFLMMGLLVLAAKATHYHFFSDAENTVWTAISQLLLIHAFGVNQHTSWNAVSWSVSAEWFAYTALFSPMVYGFRRVRKLWIGLVVAALWSSVIFYGIYIDGRGIGLTTRGVLRIIPEFMAGYFLYRILHTRRPARSGDLFTVTGLLTAAAICYLPTIYIFFLLPAVLLGFTGLFAGGTLTNFCFGNSAMILLGESSYSIYLIQEFISIFANQVLRRGHIRLSHGGFLAMILIVTVTTAIAGHLTFRHIEEPLRQAILRRWGQRNNGPENIPARTGDAPDTQVSATIS